MYNNDRDRKGSTVPMVEVISALFVSDSCWLPECRLPNEFGMDKRYFRESGFGGLLRYDVCGDSGIWNYSNVVFRGDRIVPVNQREACVAVVRERRGRCIA